MMWKFAVKGNGILVEMPSRFYIGKVIDREGPIVTLTDATCGHDLGDLGLFLEGKISVSTELTPIEDIEINLANSDTVQLYPHYLTIRRRTNEPQDEKVFEEQ